MDTEDIWIDQEKYCTGCRLLLIWIALVKAGNLLSNVENKLLTDIYVYLIL